MPTFHALLLNWRRAAAAVGLLLSFGVSVAPAAPPKLGEIVPNFALQTLDEKPVELKRLTDQGPVVLVVLRGWPGYQCPVCTRQVHDFVVHASEFGSGRAQVVMVYPGPAERLQAHAREFLEHKDWPAEFIFLLDPNYAFTNAYGLRWEAPKETAYPATFVIERGGRLRFAHISKSHGDRVGAAQAIAQLP